MRQERARAMRGKTNIGCIVWLGILVLVGYALIKIVPVKVATSTFYDTMQEQAGFGSIKPLHVIEHDVLMRAQELRLPVTKQNLKVRRSAREITIEAEYEITVEFAFGYKYVWKFHPVVSRPLFAV
ncbi:MAG TPA: hypothetical protein VIA29_03690 [Thermoanaerobaculia bacterium]